jgi:hypothetical protein
MGKAQVLVFFALQRFRTTIRGAHMTSTPSLAPLVFFEADSRPAMPNMVMGKESRPYLSMFVDGNGFRVRCFRRVADL